MRVIFVDIDGVLATRTSMGRSWPTRLPRRNAPGRDGAVAPLDPDCIRHLNRLVRLTGAGIVISATWGREFETEPLRQYLADQGVRGQILGQTPTTQHCRIRGLDISQWLMDTGQADRFCILDDHDDMGSLLPWLVKTNADVGLQDPDVSAALSLLLT